MKTIKIIAGLLLIAGFSRADTSLWTGAAGDGNYSNSGNWTAGVPSDIAEFGVQMQNNIQVDAQANVNQMTFNNGSAFNISLSTGISLTINGSGITGAANGTIFTVPTNTVMKLNNAANAGVATIAVNGVGLLQFNNSSSAGNTVIHLLNADGYGGFGVVQFNNFSTAADAKIINETNQSIYFGGSSNAGNANFQFTQGGLFFTGNSSFKNATANISNTAAVIFDGNATASNGVIVSSAGSVTDFLGNATASHASITNSSDFAFDKSVTNFSNNASAGEATINNLANSYTQFDKNSTATNATLTNNSGATNFYDVATSSNAVLNNLNAGSANFTDLSSAGNSTITNSSSGSVNFSTAATAANATIVNNNGSVNFSGVSNAANSTITNNSINSLIQFNDAANAGNAKLINNGSGLIQFNNNSNGGNTSIANNGGTFTITNVTNPEFTVGSLAGNGTFVIGSKTLTAGGNGNDTTVSGTISGVGGSLVKVGTGTMTLSGSNSYTGGTTVNGGTLNISNDNNLGVGGGLTIANGGTLQTGAGLSTNRNVTLTNGGGFIDTDGFNSTLNGNIQGSGALVKSGSGILTIAGNNTYFGGTIVEGGVLRTGSTHALPGTGDVVLESGTGATLDLNGFNQTIGSLSGGGAVLLGTATLTNGTNNTSTQYLGTLSGTGSFVKVGNGTLVLAGGTTFAGNTTVNGGTVQFVNASGETGSGASVGTIGNLRNNSAITPGVGGIGVLHASAYSGPGTLNISFKGTDHTALLVDNNANLTSGKLSITGTHFVSGNYSVLKAGSLTGLFDSVNTPSPSVFLNLRTSYTPTDVQLNITALHFADVATNSNQVQVASALDASKEPTTAAFDAATQALFNLPTAEAARAAYNQISGDSLAGFQNVGLRSAQVFTTQMSARSMQSPVITAQAPSPIQLAYAGDLIGSSLGVDAEPKKSLPSYGLWSRGLGFFDHVDANATAGSPAFNDATGGFQAGYDYPVSEDVVVGLSGGYAKTRLSVDDRSSSGNGTSVQSGLYGSYSPGQWFVNGSMAYTTSSNDMTRTIAFTGVNEQANASFQSRVYTLFAEAGYKYQPLKNSTIEPSLSLKESRLHQEGFTETGAPGLNLHVEEQDVNSTVSALGARLTHQFNSKTHHPLTVGVRGAWEHELGDIDNRITAQFADAPGSRFTVQGTPRNRNAAALGLDGRLPLTHSLQAFADYSATLSSGQSTQGFFGGLSVTW